MEWETAPDHAFAVPLQAKDEPPEDPLNGAFSPSHGDVTVPTSQGLISVPNGTVPPSQSGPGTASGVRIVSMNDLLQNSAVLGQRVSNTPTGYPDIESNAPKTLNMSVPGGQVVNIPLNTFQNALGRQPQLTDISSSHISIDNASTLENVPNLISQPHVKSDPEELPIKEEPDQIPIADEIEHTSTNISVPALNTVPSPSNHGSQTSHVIHPISRHLVPISMDVLRGTSSSINMSLPANEPIFKKNPTDMPNGQIATVAGIVPGNVKSVVPSPAQTASSGVFSNSLPNSTCPSISSLSPGTNMAVVLTPNGHFVTSPATSLPNAGKTTLSFTSVQNPGWSGGSQTINPISNGQLKPRALSGVKYGPIVRTTSERSSSTITVLKTQISKAMRKSTPATPSTLSSTQIRTNPQTPLSQVTSNTSNSKSTWPPPGWTKPQVKKPKPKIPIPLSGSWTNPNPPKAPSLKSESQPENDPLEGPVQDIYLRAANNMDTYESRRMPSIPKHALMTCHPKRTRSTSVQCSLYPLAPTTMRELVAMKEPPELKRPLIHVRGIGLDVQAKQIVYNVFRYFEQREAHFNLLYIPAEVTENATGVKHVTVRKIVREAKKLPQNDESDDVPTFKARCTRRARLKTVVSNIHIDTGLRRYFHDAFLKKKDAPGLKYIKSQCLLDGLKTGRMGVNFIRLRIKKLGFITVRTARRLVHIEGASIRAWRYKYLKQMKPFEEDNKSIVFTFVANLRSIKNSANEWEILDFSDELKVESRVLTVFHAANEKGLIDGGFFVNDTTVNPQNAVDEKFYFEWLELHVLKKIPAGSVVVLAHDRFHNMDESEVKPNAGSSKQEVVDWLKSRVNGDIDETLPKCVLLEEVSRLPVKQKYTVDSLVETYGHTPLHLPSSHRDLNPFEYFWEDVRTKLQVQGRLVALKGSLAGEFSSAEPRLKRAWKQVQKCQDFYRKNDPLLDDAQETAIKRWGGVWTSPSYGPLPNETGDLDGVDVALGEDADSSENTQTASSGSGSPTESESESDSSTESETKESSSSDSEDSVDDSALSDRINSNKRRKIE